MTMKIDRDDGIKNDDDDEDDDDEDDDDGYGDDGDDDILSRELTYPLPFSTYESNIFPFAVWSDMWSFPGG